MFFWRRVAPQIPEDGLKPTATPGYTRNFRDLNDLISQGKSFSGYERNALFLNRAGQGFAEAGALLRADFEDDARAVAMADWDRDGDLDVWITNRTAPQVRLLRNNYPSANSSVSIRLIGNGETTNCDAIGARLTLWRTSAPKLKQIRTIHAGDGFLAQSSAWAHFGIGPSEGELALSVRWPGGETESFSDLKGGARYTITQGQGIVELAPAAPLSPPNISPESVSTFVSDLGNRGLWVANQVPFPELSYTGPDGAMRSTTEFLGTPVLINLWATWCAPCIQELGVLGQHSEELRANGTDVLALNVDGLGLSGGAAAEANVEDVLSRVGYELSHGIAREENLAKIEVLIDFLSSQRVPLTIPSSFLVDADGNVAAVYQGAVEWEQLGADLSLLGSPPAAQLGRASGRTGRWFANPRQIDRAAFLGAYATQFVKSGFPEESQRLFELIKPQDGAPSAQDHYNQAKIAARSGSPEQAIEHYRAALRLEPEYGQALTGLGAIYLMQKRPGEAEVLFEKALAIDPNHATALVNLAMIDQSRGDGDSALGRLEKVIARNPEYAEAHMNIGSLLASMNRYEEAILHLSEAVKLNPKRPVAHLNLASVYMQTQQWNKAEQQYRLVQQLSPRTAYAHFGLGTLQARQGLHAEAVVSFRKAISLGLKNAQSYTRLGLSLLQLGNRQSASEVLEAALELDPDYPDAKRALQGMRLESE